MKKTRKTVMLGMPGPGTEDERIKKFKEIYDRELSIGGALYEMGKYARDLVENIKYGVCTGIDPIERIREDAEIIIAGYALIVSGEFECD